MRSLRAGITTRRQVQAAKPQDGKKGVMLYCVLSWLTGDGVVIVWGNGKEVEVGISRSNLPCDQPGELPVVDLQGREDERRVRGVFVCGLQAQWVASAWLCDHGQSLPPGVGDAEGKPGLGHTVAAIDVRQSIQSIAWRAGTSLSRPGQKHPGGGRFGFGAGVG